MSSQNASLSRFKRKKMDKCPFKKKCGGALSPLVLKNDFGSTKAAGWVIKF